MSAYRPISAQLDRSAKGVIPEHWPSRVASRVGVKLR